MPKAEVGSTKYLNNKLKSKGLQRLRFWCEVCHKQCRDDNGYKCHVMSESHTRQMQVVGLNANKVISDFSNDFQRNFLNQLRTAHSTKQVQLNRFYQEIIAEKEHVHMNSTRWSSLTEFATFLGREGLVRVEENDKGLHISWVDNSPDALRRQEAVRKKERQDKGDEEREQRMIREQIEKARLDAEARSKVDDTEESNIDLVRPEGEKIRLNFTAKNAPHNESTPPSTGEAQARDTTGDAQQATVSVEPRMAEASILPPEKISLNLNATTKPKNVFATSAKKNALGGSKVLAKEAPKRPISEAERIMKEELERKRIRPSYNAPGGLNTNSKRLKIS